VNIETFYNSLDWKKPFADLTEIDLELINHLLEISGFLFVDSGIIEND